MRPPGNLVATQSRSLVAAALPRPPPRKHDEAIVLARFSAGDTGIDAGVDHGGGLVRLPPEEMHSGLGSAVPHHARGLEVGGFHGSSIDPAGSFPDVQQISCSPVNNRKKNRPRARGGAILRTHHLDYRAPWGGRLRA